MKLLSTLMIFSILSGCVSNFPLAQKKLYGSSKYGSAPVYTEEERKKDVDNFQKNFRYFTSVEEKQESFANAPDYLFLNKFLLQIEHLKDKYGIPYKIKTTNDQLFQDDNKTELNQLHTRLQNKIIKIRTKRDYELPLGGRYRLHKKNLAEEIFYNNKMGHEQLSLAFLESMQYSNPDEAEPTSQTSELMREIDGLVSNIPLNFSTEYFKISLDNNFEEKWHRPAILSETLNFETFMNEGKAHPHISALNFLLSHRRFRNEEQYQLEHPLVIFDKGHILPAFAKYDDGDFVIEAILPYARGKGVINYGKSRNLSNSLMILTADDFIFSYVFKDYLTAENMEKYLVKAQNKTAALYGLAKIKTWNNSASQSYLLHKAANLPQIRPLITEISASQWYGWLLNHSKVRKLASDFKVSK